MRRVLFALLFVIAACAPADVAPETEPTVPTTDPEAVPEPEPVVEVRPDPNPDVVALWDRVDSLKGYSFTLARLPEKSGELSYRVRDGKAVIELVTPLDMDGWSADYIYVDYGQGHATAYCLELGSCMDDARKGLVSFEEYGVKLPTRWLDEIQYGEIVGRQQFNDRQVTVVRWEDEGLSYEAYLDNFYGLPQRVAIATDSEFTDIVGGQEYQGVQTNNVKPEDVEPPY